MTAPLLHQLLTPDTNPHILDTAEDVIAAQKRTPEWLALFLALLPALPMAFLYTWPAAWPAASEFQRQNWGNLITTWGLAVSIGALLFAKGAKTAADQARKELRRRSLAEELSDAHSKSIEVGARIHDGHWDIVFLRAQEVSAACGVILSHRAWLPPASKQSIGKARDQAGSIEKFAMTAKLAAPNQQQILTAAASQRQLRDLLGTELGAALADAEGSKNKNE